MPSQSIGLTPKSLKNRAENARFVMSLSCFHYLRQLKLFYYDTYIKKISFTKTAGLVSFCLYIVSKGFEEKQN